jgi:DNA-binding GntR family transcriptional regulator
MPRKPSSANSTPLSDSLAVSSVSIDQIIRSLTDAIVGKRLPPGTWLREEALGRTYGVSRTKIRAALMALSKERLVEMVPDKGAFVSRPSVKEAREVFALRRLLEAEVVRLLVVDGHPSAYKRLDQHLKAERSGLTRKSVTSPVSERMLGDFHVVLAELAGNQTLAHMVSELVSRSSLIAMLYHSTNDPRCSTEEHEQLVKACRSGNVQEAVSLMVDHLQRIEHNLDLSGQRETEAPDLLQSLLLS